MSIDLAVVEGGDRYAVPRGRRITIDAKPNFFHVDPPVGEPP
jgi:hypothetical protein